MPPMTARPEFAQRAQPADSATSAGSSALSEGSDTKASGGEREAAATQGF